MAEQRLCATLAVKNRRGLHARAAAKLVTIAESYTSNIEVSRDDQTVSARSIMGLLLLGAGQGCFVEVCATGDDAPAALTAVSALVECGFHEED